MLLLTTKYKYFVLPRIHFVIQLCTAVSKGIYISSFFDIIGISCRFPNVVPIFAFSWHPQFFISNTLVGFMKIIIIKNISGNFTYMKIVRYGCAKDCICNLIIPIRAFVYFVTGSAPE